ncbi:MAG: hypothetical protein GXC73_13125, partial [Chitinophagaceae bacterium]|nr:hypothetical protein [Chitinophagaceae bacterium]
YAQQAYAFYKDDEGLAGIGLYNYRYNEFAYTPFEPLTDGYDNYFMQVPCSCGQLWTRQQWQLFKTYLANEKTEEAEPSVFMPKEALRWPVKTSWKRSFFKYMVETDKFFVYPRVSLTTNFGDAGQHYADSVYIWQTPLLYSKKEYLFSNLNKSVSLYDAFFELHTQGYHRITNTSLSVSFDLNGTKPLEKIQTEYLVSCKQCNRPQTLYLPALYPYECNIISAVTTADAEAAGFSFGKTENFTTTQLFERLNVDVRRVFFHTGYIIDAAKKEVYHTLPYRLGMLALWPKHFVQRVITKIRSLAGKTTNSFL